MDLLRILNTSSHANVIAKLRKTPATAPMIPPGRIPESLLKQKMDSSPIRKFLTTVRK